MFCESALVLHVLCKLDFDNQLMTHRVAHRSGRSSSEPGSGSGSSSASDDSAGGSARSSGSGKSKVSGKSETPSAVEIVKLGAVEPARAPREPVASSSHILESGTLWLGGFRFSQKLSKARDHVGWQVSCLHKCHKDDSRPNCRRTRNFKHAEGGEELCIRKLKWWCLRCFDEDVGTRDQHCDKHGGVGLIGPDSSSGRCL